MNPPLRPVQVVKMTLVLLNRATYTGTSRVVVWLVCLIGIVQAALPLLELCLH